MDAQHLSKLPIFSSALGSLNKSVLTLEDEEEISIDNPVSILAIAKKHDLKSIFLLENSMASAIKAFELFSKHNIQLRFGVKISLAHDENNIDSSLGKYSLFALNEDGYYELINITSEHAIKNVGNKKPQPVLFNDIKDKLTSKNILLMIPFYDSFIYNNSFYFNFAMPNFEGLNPIFCIEEHNVAQDYLIKQKVEEYCKLNNYDVINTHSVYYYSPEYFKGYLIYRSVEHRGSWFKPEIKDFSSDKFSFKDICNG